MSFDVRCVRLALEFLFDCPEINTPEIRAELAQVIQDAIEDFIQERLAK